MASTVPPERTMVLSETSGMLRRIATVMVREHGEYLCMVGGKRVRVVARTCEGCGEAEPTKRYMCRFGYVAEGAEAPTLEEAPWEPCEYCDECAGLARGNWNGETLAIEGPVA